MKLVIENDIIYLDGIEIEGVLEYQLKVDATSLPELSLRLFVETNLSLNRSSIDHGNDIGADLEVIAEGLAERIRKAESFKNGNN